MWKTRVGDMEKVKENANYLAKNSTQNILEKI